DADSAQPQTIGSAVAGYVCPFQTLPAWPATMDGGLNETQRNFFGHEGKMVRQQCVFPQNPLCSIGVREIGIEACGQQRCWAECVGVSALQPYLQCGAGQTMNVQVPPPFEVPGHSAHHELARAKVRNEPRPQKLTSSRMLAR